MTWSITKILKLDSLILDPLKMKQETMVDDTPEVTRKLGVTYNQRITHTTFTTTTC